MAQSKKPGAGSLKLKLPTGTTKAAYFDSDYASSLKRTLLGLQAVEDLPLDFDGTWEPLGKQVTTSDTTSFIVSNFTLNFNVYWMQLVGQQASGSLTTTTMFVSSDGGVTNVANNYSYQYTQQNTSFTPSAPVASPNSSAIIIPGALGAATHRKTTNLYIYEPMNSNVETTIMYSLGSFDRASPFATAFARGWGTQRVKAAHNAIVLTNGSGRTWTAGNINVWGQAV